MMELLINLVKVYLFVLLTWNVGKFLLGKHGKKKSIIGKVLMLISNRVGYMLDDMLKRQKRKRYKVLHHTKVAKVIDIKKYKVKRA